MVVHSRVPNPNGERIRESTTDSIIVAFLFLVAVLVSLCVGRVVVWVRETASVLLLFLLVVVVSQRVTVVVVVAVARPQEKDRWSSAVAVEDGQGRADRDNACEHEDGGGDDDDEAAVAEDSRDGGDDEGENDHDAKEARLDGDGCAVDSLTWIDCSCCCCCWCWDCCNWHAR